MTSKYLKFVQESSSFVFFLENKASVNKCTTLKRFVFRMKFPEQYCSIELYVSVKLTVKLVEMLTVICRDLLLLLSVLLLASVPIKYL